MISEKSYGILGRVSTEMQANDGDSLVMQRELAQAYVEENGGVIYDYYIEEGLSASKTRIENRPKLLKLIEDIENGKVNHVIAYKRDRIMRNAEEMMWFLRKLGESNCDITLTARGESQIDMVGYKNSGASKIMEVVSATFAEMESAFISARVSDTMLSKAKKGEFTGGLLPYGYKIENNIAKPIESEIPVIEEIVGLYLKGFGIHAICKWLNGLEVVGLGSRLIVPRRIKQHKNSSDEWTYETIKGILFNSIYSGYFTYKSLKNPEMDTLKVKSDQIVPIRSESIQKEIDNILKKKVKSKQAPRKFNTPFLLSGILKCDECGGNFKTRSSQKKNGEKYSYYVCQNRNKTNSEKCNSRSYKQETLENYVLKEAKIYMERFINSDSHEIVKKEIEKKNDGISEKIKDIDVKINTHQKNFDKFMNLILELDANDISYVLFKDKYQLAQKEELIKLSNFQATKQSLLLEASAQEEREFDIDLVVKTAVNFSTIMESSSVPLKKQMLDKFFSSITISPNGDVTLSLSFELPTKSMEDINEFISLGGIGQTTATIDQTVATMDEISKNTDHLASMAEKLNKEVQHFKL